VSVGWDDDPVVAAWPGLPRLAGDRHADACVVGLGASGLAAVFALAERGLSVIGLDAGRVAAAAAGRNGGFQLGGPAPSLPDAIAAWGGEAAIGLYRATLRELDDLEAALGPDVIRRVGSIRLAGLPGAPTSAAEAADRERELAACAEQEAALRAHGIAVERYDGPLGAGLYLPDDAAMNPARRAVELAARLARHDRVRLYEHTPVAELVPGRVVAEGATVSAPIVIVAVDGGLEVLLPQLAGWVRTARLQMLAAEPGGPLAPGRVPCPVYGRWGYDYAQQAADGRLFVGGGRDRFAEDEWVAPPAAAEPTAPVQAYVETVAARMAGGPVRVTHRWAAPVGFTPDGRALCTVVEREDTEELVVAVGGYSGTGNLVGPVAARAAVALALDGTPPPPYFAG
jgi:glycine/D-amino acid oxidase-like deaminating enzyme